MTKLEILIAFVFFCTCAIVGPMWLAHKFRDSLRFDDEDDEPPDDE